ncbi:MAG: hypothetical protein ABSD27_13845 [Bryobacteraceae bacterium]|jgi:hypothetical protein
MTGNRSSAYPARWTRVCQALLAVGAAAFLFALASGQAQRAWQAYLLNFVLWTGIAQCGVVFAAAYQMTNAGWSDALRRMGESLAFFLPVSLALFLVMMAFGAPSIFPWARQPYPGREIWLTVPFVAARDFAILAAVSALSFAYVYYSERRAVSAAVAVGRLPRSKWIDRWIAGAGDPTVSERRTRTLAPALLIAFGLGYSLIGFDLVMSLEPAWANTLFGWYFYVGAFYSLLAVLAIAGFVFRKHWNLEHHLGPDQTHDLGRLLLGICLLTGGFFWAQWLVFWYGNLPEEVGHVIPRFYQMPFAPFGWVSAYGAFLVPMVFLLSKALKRRPVRLMWVAVWILAMLWLERYVWIVPSSGRADHAPLLVEMLVTAGFLGGFVWGWISHNRRLPIAAIAALPGPRTH